MRLRTSFFDWTVFRKDIVRFAPLWGLYFILCLIFMHNAIQLDPLRFSYSGQMMARINSARTGMAALGTFRKFASINFVYAGLVAGCLFGDLFHARRCYALHALPIRREGWFITHTLAGLCYSLVPNVLIMCSFMDKVSVFPYLGGAWLLGVSLQYLFFFGVAVFSLQCCGNWVGMVSVYTFLNFASMIALWFCNTVFIPQMYGLLAVAEKPFRLLCPVVQWGDQYAESLMRWTYQGEDVIGGPPYGCRGFYLAGWNHSIAAAMVGVVLLVAGLLLFRRRKLECAGDVVAAKFLRPVFAVVFTLCTGAGTAMLGQEIELDCLLCLPVGMAVGWLVAQMFLQRTVRVFRLKVLRNGALVIAALFLCVLLSKLDVLGIVRWMPEQDTIEHVGVYSWNRLDYEKLPGKYYSMKLTEAQDLEKILSVHEDIVACRNKKTENRYPIMLEYYFKDGTKTFRFYWAPVESASYEHLCSMVDDPVRTYGYSNVEILAKNIKSIELGKNEISAEYIEEVIRALWEEQQKGYIAEGDFEDEAFEVVVWWMKGNKTERVKMKVRSGAEKTIALRESLRWK